MRRTSWKPRVTRVTCRTRCVSRDIKSPLTEKSCHFRPHRVFAVRQQTTSLQISACLCGIRFYILDVFAGLLCRRHARLGEGRLVSTCWASIWRHTVESTNCNMRLGARKQNFRSIYRFWAPFANRYRDYPINFIAVRFRGFVFGCFRGQPALTKKNIRIYLNSWIVL